MDSEVGSDVITQKFNGNGTTAWTAVVSASFKACTF